MRIDGTSKNLTKETKMASHPNATKRSIGPIRRLKAAAGIGLGLSVIAVFGVFVAAGDATSATAPTNSAPPTISGAAQRGATLTADKGTWSGSDPITYSYQWLRCDTNGGSCSSIIGETSTTYLLKGVDLGATLRAVVTATNADGTNAATTVPTAVVTSVVTTPPVNAAQPTIAGTAQAGKTLLAYRGTWTGTAPISYTYRWMRCDKKGGSCSFIGGSTRLTSHQVTSADVGNTLRVDVTATNPAGSKAVNSAPTAVVAAGAAAPAPAPATGCTKTGGVIPVASVGSPARLLIDQFQVSPSAITYGTRFLTLRFHVSACGGPVQGALVYATPTPYGQFSNASEQATDATGWATVQLSALPGFPLSSKQQLLVMFVRARKSGENLLGGISSRRLISFPVVR
jgi:hypothetical protein